MSLFRGENLVSCNVVTPVITGVTDASAAAAGVVGEKLISLVAVGSAVSLTTATPANVTTLTLTPGDWSVEGSVNFTAGSATTAAGANFAVGIGSVSATLPTDGSEVQVVIPTYTTTSFKAGVAVPLVQFSVSASTPIYLVAQGAFSAGTLAGYGKLVARRVR